MYEVLVFFGECERPAERVCVERASDVMPTVQPLIRRNRGCGRVEVRYEERILFSISGPQRFADAETKNLEGRGP